MITLLTGQPGNGKTSKIINIIKDALEEGRVVYTCGIPKLLLPVIQISRHQLMLWQERTAVLVAEKEKVAFTYTPRAKLEYEQHIQSTAIKLTDNFMAVRNEEGEEEPVFVLNNIAEGSLIIVDEAQKGFQPTGVNVPEHVSYLSEHRHHGLDFVFISQYPHLVHKTVQALATRHWHIRFTWKGRKLYEWPEWEATPASESSMKNAVVEKYTIDPKTFDLYESASIHTKVSHKVPKYVYFILFSFVMLPIMGYYSFHRIYAKTQKHPTEQKGVITKNETTIPIAENFTNNQPIPTVSQIVYEPLQVVSTKYDWKQIGACVSFKHTCKCFGDSAELLVVPKDVCTMAVNVGWGGRERTANNAPLGGGRKDDNDASSTSGNSKTVGTEQERYWNIPDSPPNARRPSPTNAS